MIAILAQDRKTLGRWLQRSIYEILETSSHLHIEPLTAMLNLMIAGSIPGTRSYWTEAASYHLEAQQNTL